MNISAFNLTVTCASTVAEQLMVVLNPKLMVNHGVIYKNYYPVVWHILDFPVGSQPIQISYDSTLTAVLQEITEDNIVNAAVYMPVTKENNKFNIVEVDNLYDLQAQGKVNPGSAASIYNNVSGEAFDVGLGDSTGRSYFTMNIQGNEDINFTFDAEFAIVPVGETVQDQGKMVTGTVHRPWFSFKITDLTSDNIGFTFDGENLSNVTGIAMIVHHTDDEEVFG
ncbi:hypothetical protein EC973_004144 [Apophysomyces ossiformis]|uniref:Uncharacterized protein n=1 Tax=Apophysomyces ossiformis TaxID=679940 RepID=A0A8H7BIL6_9FUNG|nr:hypothetical protein EC973_004144 [Apophysomyces ossiformis]